MITPRLVRRALLRSCPGALALFALALALDTPLSSAVAFALLGLAPGSLLPLETWALTWPDPTTTRSQIKLALLGWALATAVLVVLLLQAVYAQAGLDGQDPLTAVSTFGGHEAWWVLPWMCAFPALALAASTCLLVSLDHQPKSKDGGPLTGIAALALGWLLLLASPLLLAPGEMSREGLAYLLLMAVISAIAIGVAIPIGATLSVLADALEEWLWPKRP